MIEFKINVMEVFLFNHTWTLDITIKLICKIQKNPLSEYKFNNKIITFF